MFHNTTADLQDQDQNEKNEKRKTTVAPLVFRFSFFLNLDTGIKAENGLMA